MKTRRLLAMAAFAVALATQSPLHAHRTSGLQQASLVDIVPSQVEVEVTLLPGVDIAPRICALLDPNGDGLCSPAESRAWATDFLAAQSVTVDGHSLPLTLGSVRLCPLPEMSSGHAEIVVSFSASLGSLAQGSRTVLCVNRYEALPSGYQVNGLLPRTPGLRIRSHKGNDRQQELTLVAEFPNSTPVVSPHESQLPAAPPPSAPNWIPKWIAGLGFGVALLTATAVPPRFMGAPKW